MTQLDLSAAGMITREQSQQWCWIQFVKRGDELTHSGQGFTMILRQELGESLKICLFKLVKIIRRRLNSIDPKNFAHQPYRYGAIQPPISRGMARLL
jgi:hypothetical protein